MDAYKERLEQLKQESARELGVNLNQTKDITAREAGSVGGRMVQKIFDSYKKSSGSFRYMRYKLFSII